MTTELLTTNDAIVKYAVTAAQPKDISAISSAPPPPDTDEIFNCSDIPKYSELHLDTPCPHRMCMIKDFSPRLHLIGRPHGPYTEVLKHAKVKKGSVVFDFLEGKYLYIEDVTERSTPPESYPDCKIVELNGSLVRITMRGRSFNILETRVIDDVALEITISQEGRLPGKFLFKALVVISDQLQDIALGAAPWNNNMLVDMMKHLKEYCLTMDNAYFTSFEVENEARGWQMSDLLHNRVNQIGIVCDCQSREQVCCTEVDSGESSKVSALFPSDRNTITFDTRLTEDGNFTGNNKFTNCQYRMEESRIYLDFTTTSFSFTTEIFSSKVFGKFLRVEGPFFEKNVAVFTLVNVTEGGDGQITLLTKLK